MKICLVHKSDPHTGKGKFAQRLTAALIQMGLTVVQNPRERVHIDLQFGKRAYEPTMANATVLRLGPAHVDKRQDYRKLNIPKWKAAKRSDGIIYQSEYSQRVCHRFLGKPKGMETIIPNAVPITEYRMPPPGPWPPRS